MRESERERERDLRDLRDHISDRINFLCDYFF